ncbi:4'-phosphopantetheinyl transferase superfamily protein [Blastococcus sp. CT_GayMR19]|uniref:4'-phosphopantetheinyl transferase family protein n=1 Tax=Blastococcus sp. CT_GayMR19 TaxID=2559608 RepID=UPI0014311501|nr:4'-phosphopantetheinyl transferase superfamily protein [Blastococcus sp. CT_GayMR19]
MWVWRIDVTDGRHEDFVAATHLTDAERLRASLGTDAVRRRRILLRGALRQVLGGLLDVLPARVPLVEDGGRPLLPTDRGLRFSCSASGRVGLVAVAAGSDVGVDVQEHRDEDARAATAEGWLTTAEERALQGLPPADRLRAVTRCWTQKEAVLKGLGLGLRQAPVTVATPVAPAGRIGEWWTAPVAVRPGHVASVVIRTPQDEVDLVVRDMIVGET